MATRSRSPVRRKARPPARASYAVMQSRWYLDTGKALARERGLYARDADPEQRGNYLAAKRAQRIAKLAGDVKNLRQFFRGFESKEGYSLKELQRWPAARVKKVEQYAEYLSHLQSQTYKRYVPRSKVQETVARGLTGQLLNDQKAFVVHVDSERDRVRITRDGEIFIEREIKDRAGRTRIAVIYDVYYLFMFYLGWRPATWDQVERATEDMLPYLPDDNSRYFMYSELHGAIGVGQPKKSLLAVVRRYAYEYSMKNFADTIIGFKRVGSKMEASAEYTRKKLLSQQRREMRERVWNQLRRKTVRRFRK